MNAYVWSKVKHKCINPNGHPDGTETACEVFNPSNPEASRKILWNRERLYHCRSQTVLTQDKER